MGRSVLDDLGEEVTGIVAPVSLCMALTVALVRILNPSGSSDSNAVFIASAFYNEQEGDSTGTKLTGSLINALIFVGVVAAMTFILVLLFKYGCTRLIYAYMGFAGFSIFFVLTGIISLELLQKWDIELDFISFSYMLWNFAVVGAVTLFFFPAPLLMKQAYLVVTGVVTAFVFTWIPEWTTWVLLVAMAIYDILAVLVPGGPLRVLVEMAQEREETIPALVYEARPSRRDLIPPRQRPGPPAGLGRGSAEALVGDTDEATTIAVAPPQEELQSSPPAELGGMVYRRRPHAPAQQQEQQLAALERASAAGSERVPEPPAEDPGTPLMGPARVDSASPGQAEAAVVAAAAASAARPYSASLPELGPGPRQVTVQMSAASAPGAAAEQLQQQQGELLHVGGTDGILTPEQEAAAVAHPSEATALGMPEAIKLGLGDFIFYSVLMGRAAMYDWLTVFACYLAIIAGLGATLLLLALAQKALPALPVSISLAVVFYFVSRYVMEPVILPMTLQLVYF